MLQNEKAKILRIKLSSGMDCLSREEREKAVSFGFALNAVGGARYQSSPSPLSLHGVPARFLI